MKKNHLAFIFLLIGFIVSRVGANLLDETNFPNEPVKIRAKDAKHHIGENAVVTGLISEIFVSSQTTNVYLYLDGDIKNAQFAAVWPGTNDPPVEKLKELIFNAAPVISVSGRIIFEKSVPEIIVNSWSEINQQPQKE